MEVRIRGRKEGREGGREGGQKEGRKDRWTEMPQEPVVLGLNIYNPLSAG